VTKYVATVLAAYASCQSSKESLLKRAVPSVYGFWRSGESGDAHKGCAFPKIPALGVGFRRMVSCAQRHQA
jgi:hypothetical protein